MSDLSVIRLNLETVVDGSFTRNVSEDTQRDRLRAVQLYGPSLLMEMGECEYCRFFVFSYKLL